MNKIKSSKNSIILFLTAVITLLCFSAYSLFNQPKAFADSAQKVSINIGKEILSANGDSRTGTYNLYGNGYNLVDYFTYERVGHALAQSNDSYENGFHYKVIGASSWVKGEGALTSNININANLVNAGLNGYLYVSPSGTAYGYDHRKDKLTVQFKDGNGNLLFNQQVANNGTINLSGNYQVTTASYQMYFNVIVDGSGISPCEMKIENTALTFTSADIMGPTINNLVSSSTYAKMRNITFNATDNEAGLAQIVVLFNNEVVKETSITDNLKSTDFNFDVYQNGTYTIRAVDNVGNVNETTYVENNIDIYAPLSPTLELDSTYAGLSASVNVILPENNGGSLEHFVYTTDGSTPVVGGSELINGINTFTFNSYGVNNIKLLCYDDLGNTLDVITYELTLKQPIVIGVEKTVFNYNGEPINLNIFDDSDLNLEYIVKYYNSANEELISLTDAGTYKVVITVETTEAYGKFEGQIDILPIQIPELPKSKVYDGKSIDFDWATQNGFSYTFTNNGTTIENPINVGTYTFNLNIDENNTNYAGARTCEFQITKRPAKVVATSVEVTYGDGYTLGYTTENFLETDNIAFEINEITSIDAGTYTISVVQKSLTNYEVEYLNGTLLINPKSITVTAKEKSKFYGEADGTLEYAVIGLLDTDTLSGSLGREVGEDVGEYEILINTLSNSNYTINFISNIFTIKQAEVSISASGSKVYGAQEENIIYSITSGKFFQNENLTSMLSRAEGEDVGEYTIYLQNTLTNYNVTLEPSVFSIVPKDLILSAQGSKFYGDELEKIEYSILNDVVLSDISGLFNRTAGEEVGSYAINIDASTLTNYNVILQPSVFRIFARELIVSASGNKVYGDTNEVIQYKILKGEFVGDLSGLFSREIGEDVGTYFITIAENHNFKIALLPTSKFTISPKTVVVTANECSKVYGQTDDLTYETNGLINSDMLSGSLSRAAGENVGTYEINAGTLNNKNYTIIFEKANLTINKCDLTVTAENKSKVYGSKDATLTYICDKDFDESDVTIVLNREAGEDVGDYEINCSAFESKNYNLIYVKGCFTITPKNLTISANSYEKVYSTSDPKFEYTILGLINNDDLGLEIYREIGENTGEYAINVKAGNPNYLITINQGTLKITPAETIITASDQVCVYDGTAKSLEFTTNNENDTLVEITKNDSVVTEATDAGIYEINIMVSASDNFKAASKKVTLTIEKASANITILNETLVYTGDVINPEIESGNLEYYIEFDDMFTAHEIGIHSYTIRFTNENYLPIRSTLQIIEKPEVEEDGITVSFVDGIIKDSGAKLILSETNDYSNAKRAVGDFQVDKTYQVRLTDSSNAKMNISVDYNLDNYDNVFVFVYNDDNEIKPIAYNVENGKLNFMINGTDAKFAIVIKTTSMSLIAISLIIFISLMIILFIVLKLRKRHKKRILKIC